MNRIKRYCALLLAVALAFGLAFQPWITGVFAEGIDPAGQLTEPEGGEPVDAVEPVCSCGGADGVHAEGCPLYAPPAPPCPECGGADGAHTGECSQNVLPATVCPECGGENDVHSEECSHYVPAEASCTCGSEDDVHTEDCPLYVAPPTPECNCGTETGVHAEDCPLYVAPETECNCGTETDVHAEDCPLYVAPETECTCEAVDGVHTEDCPLYVAPETECNCGTETDVHAEDCPLYVAPETECTCEAVDGVHTEDCPLYVAPETECTCEAADGVHTEDCPLYVAPETECTCEAVDGVHAEGCPLYTPPALPCPECGEAAGAHKETCSQYVKGPVSFPWAELTDGEFAAWLTDGANAETVKAVLGGEGEEYDALNARIDAILAGEDEALALRVQEYLAALTAADQPTVLPMTGPKVTGYICFDLALGDVTIGASSYSGYVNVAGTSMPVSATTRTGDEKFYIYQSTDENRENTGYVDNNAFQTKGDCYIPEYTRVEIIPEGETTPILWTKYITNNPNVTEVSQNWENVAGTTGRKPLGEQKSGATASTGNHIIFKTESNYTADVTIDNIWTYHQAHGATRTTGGITAHLTHQNNTQITIRLKGDNRVGNVHYGAKANKNGNQIIFENGEAEGQEPGSITVGDFPTDFGKNFWCSVIGGDDNSGDWSDGIVIKGGVIWAGATVDDNCSAIGGGGNQYGGVTIKGGIVTAVTAGTGTAIGGGLGVGDAGGNTDVVIEGGKIYAYNFGVEKGKGQITSAAFIPSAAIGGGGSQNSAGNLNASVTINGGFVYAQSTGGPAIGGGSSANQNGGNATVTINGGTVIAKSVPGTYNNTTVSASVGIGGGTGKTFGGSVTLNIHKKDPTNNPTIVRTGSIGGGLSTATGKVGSAKVTITGGDIAGQVVMAGTGDPNNYCTFTMSGGWIHGTNVVDGNTITSVPDPNQDAPLLFRHDDGGAVWMQDPNGVAKISGDAVIEGCTANLGGAIYMEGGKLFMSGGTIRDTTAKATKVKQDDGSFKLETGRGGAINIAGGTAEISGGAIENCTANLGGAVYMAGGKTGEGGGTLTMKGGTIESCTAEALFENTDGTDELLQTGRGGAINMMGGAVTISGDAVIEGCTANLGGAVYMAAGTAGGHGGTFTMTDGTIRNNNANPTTDSKGTVLGTGRGGGINMIGGEVTISGGAITGCTAELGGGVYMANAESATVHTLDAEGGMSRAQGGTFTMNGGQITGNTATGNIPAGTGRGGGACVYGGNVSLANGSISGNTAETRGGGLYVTNGDVHVQGGFISENKAKYRGGGVFLEDGLFTMTGGKITDNTAGYRGGGLFLTKSPTLTRGVISGNKATGGVTSSTTGAVLEGSGGGVCIKGDELVLTNPDIQIFGNTAENGGGVAVLNGHFILNGGNVGVKDEAPNVASKNGGGVYVANDSDTTVSDDNKASVTVSSGNIWYNKAHKGGGVYLASGDVSILGTASICHNVAELTEEEQAQVNDGNTNVDGGKGGGVYLGKDAGKFVLDGPDASINNNTAYRGGGAYLYSDPTMNQGRISDNTAVLNGGGLFVSDCLVTLNAAQDVTITGNHAVNGGGILINKLDPNSTAVAGLVMNSGMQGTILLSGNVATGSGGAVCVSNGHFDMKSDKVTIVSNQAVNGGGVAVSRGTFTMTAGEIGENGRANTATDGGGVYVSGGTILMKGGVVQYNTATNGGGGMYVNHGTIRMSGGVVQYNEAMDGGGACVTGGLGSNGGWLIVENGAFLNNTATNRGGGGYAAGDFHMRQGTIQGNKATDGGGIFVDQGNATMVNGAITRNYASRDGGGVCIVSSNSGDTIKMYMLSGQLDYNEAGRYGGGLAVEGSGAQAIQVEIGCLLDHHVTDGAPGLPIDYTEQYQNYVKDGDEVLFDIGRHESCPRVEYNQAGEVGGAIYLNSDSSTLRFHCVLEDNNSTLAPDAADMDVEGGTVIIGDDVYHNYQHDSSNTGKHHGQPWGYVIMEDGTTVNSGQVDIYGNMGNPIFKKDILVDIADKNNDHFKDHRLSENKDRHRIHYFENFNEVGLYRAFQYDETVTSVTVQSALFSQPGYTIKGWCTKPNTTDEGAKTYNVGDTIDFTQTNIPGMGNHHTDCEICKNYDSKKLMVLYAIWETNGYTVVFDPNVAPGDTYTGTMAEQGFVYGVAQSLSQNTYKYPGHFFSKWTTNADGSGETYTDEQQVENLTSQNNGKVTLYAQWEVCDHKTKGERTYSADGKTLTRTCSCGGQTLTATLSAADTVYDGLPHPAKLTVNDADAWGEDAPEITYTAAWLEDDGISHAEGTKPELSADGKPFHAGNYTATITKKNGETDVTATVTYSIEKAEQEAPDKPTYQAVTSGSTTTVKINKLADKELTAGGQTNTATVEYSLAYSGASIVWQKVPAGSNTLDITLTTALTNYTVQARYAELEDYKPSEIKKADAVYFFAGDVTVKIICDDGINCDEVTANGDDTKTNGISLTLTTDEKYYLVSEGYNVTAVITPKDSSVTANTPTVTQKTGTTNEYSITNIQNDSTLTITIGTAKKKPTSDGKVAPGQEFSDFNGGTTTISRDSAFTAAFQVKNYDPVRTVDSVEVGAYTGLKLTFGANIPVDTTIILLDRRDGSYWHYRAASEVSSVPLTDFQKMGGTVSDKYAIPTLTAAAGYVELKYQFIVDFSQTASGCSVNSLKMALEATRKAPDTTKAPEIKPEVTVGMKDSGFTFAKTAAPAALARTASTAGLTNSFTYTFTKGADASKWENRASALVLTPTAGTTLPQDARIKAVVDGGITYLYRSGGSFIVPLSLLDEGAKTVSLTLESDLFPDTEQSYTFTVQWQISPSGAGKAPMDGEQKGSISNVTFTSTAKVEPSLKITGSRVLSAADTLHLTLTALNMNTTDYTISAAILHKVKGEYIGTGRELEVEKLTNGTGSVDVALGAQTASSSSYCVVFTVKTKEPMSIVMEVPFYFVIKPTE